ncbi:VOC family protein [Nodosilinea sp. LEGE 07088]|uniref:VOC family protein n=1 Tax=Nodosilinea sp. LEGE 07088 TaxID=2777968 RepID=UPI0018809CB1|nr:VOC family protein [Nodosilinea sp. LEGE 07088]MBE9138169.1 VOC family protein [Nodosilinea sp. LEGE 07088]
MAMTQGAHHIGLTVPSINATRDFFVNVLEFKLVGEKPDYPAYFLSDGTLMLTLWQAADPALATPFDRRNNLGLHHFALKVEGLETLHSLHQTLAAAEGVQIEFAPEPLGAGPTHHMMLSIPGGIRMELIAPGG